MLQKNMSQGLPNPGFMQEKVNFLKKDSRELKKNFVLGSYGQRPKAWNAKLEAGIFLAV